MNRRRADRLTQAHRYAPPVIADRAGTVPFQCDRDIFTVAGQMLVDSIVHDLIDQVIETLSGSAADVHTRTLADGLQALQHLYARSIIGFLFSHKYTPVHAAPRNTCGERRTRAL